tara:strand:- start:100 stop:690 length:591 start_codon:yes stop_codon:yes gene_type:complete
MTEAKIPELKGLKREASKIKKCDVDICEEQGIYPAPRNRDELRSYFWFCLKHVREYNKRWNYFDGLNGDALEAEIRSATTWERPSWKFGTGRADPDYGTSHNFSSEDVFGFFSESYKERKNFVQRTMHPDERWAWKIFNMEPCSEQEKIKKHYKKLAKLNHPDRNQGDADAEERLKEINCAYAILKQLYPLSDSKP